MDTFHDQIWDAVPPRRPLERATLGWALETVAGAQDVLDMGCGDGRYTAELARGGAHVVGVDRSETALERARRAHPELEFRSSAVDGRLPLDDTSFDAAICINVLEHVADTQLLLSEIRRVLRPRGWIAIAVLYHGRLKNVAIALRSFERHHDPLEPVLRFYTRRSLRTLLESLGFDRVELGTAGGPPLLRRTLLARARRG